MALNNRQLKAVEMLVYTDKKKQEIAEEIGISNVTLSNWLNKEEFQEAIHKEMLRSFSHLATKAKRKMEQLLDSNQDSVAFAAAKEILNKAGYAETQTIEHEYKNNIVLEIVD
jgi:transposase